MFSDLKHQKGNWNPVSVKNYEDSPIRERIRVSRDSSLELVNSKRGNLYDLRAQASIKYKIHFILTVFQHFSDARLRYTLC
jgi:hypothetical protein